VLQYGFSTKSSDANSRGAHGRGVGLALVRQAVQRLNGTMTISNPGGAQFHVVLPAPVPEEEKA
jgi:two-component system CitB family sensor kinase